MNTLILATRNQGKLREIQQMLGEYIHVQTLDEFPDAPDVVEDGDTFEANAIKKAREIAQHTGLPALADDSGLVVDTLNGAPGIYSARFAGKNATDEDNNAKLIDQLRGIPENQRTARFCCVMALVTPNGEIQTTKAAWEGLILTKARGDNGFGYDPLFFDPTHNCTSAELPTAEKNRLSHRGQALRAILPKIHDLFSISQPKWYQKNWVILSFIMAIIITTTVVLVSLRGVDPVISNFNLFKPTKSTTTEKTSTP